MRTLSHYEVAQHLDRLSAGPQAPPVRPTFAEGMEATKGGRYGFSPYSLSPLIPRPSKQYTGKATTEADARDLSVMRLDLKLKKLTEKKPDEKRNKYAGHIANRIIIDDPYGPSSD